MEFHFHISCFDRSSAPKRKHSPSSSPNRCINHAVTFPQWNEQRTRRNFKSSESATYRRSHFMCEAQNAFRSLIFQALFIDFEFIFNKGQLLKQFYYEESDPFSNLAEVFNSIPFVSNNRIKWQ